MTPHPLTHEPVAAPSTPTPNPWLMIVLHGLGDSLEGYRWLPAALNLPWLNYLLVNAPDPYYGGFSWFDFPGNPAPGIRRSRQLLQDLLAAQEKNGFAPEHTFLFGFSQGCLMVLETGWRYPRRFAGLIGLSGFLADPEALIRERSPLAPQQRALVTHGLFDPLLPLGPVRAQIQSLKAAGLAIEWHELRKEHTIAGEEEINLIRDFAQRQHRHD